MENGSDQLRGYDGSATAGGITDLGCGYGPRLLPPLQGTRIAVRSRSVDVEKNQHRGGSYDKNDNRFLHADVTAVLYRNRIFIFSYHTLPPLFPSSRGITPVYFRIRAGGILSGTGITNQGLPNTRLTIFSTRLTGFNKKQEAFHFLL